MAIDDLMNQGRPGALGQGLNYAASQIQRRIGQNGAAYRKAGDQVEKTTDRARKVANEAAAASAELNKAVTEELRVLVDKRNRPIAVLFFKPNIDPKRVGQLVRTAQAKSKRAAGELNKAAAAAQKLREIRSGAASRASRSSSTGSRSTGSTGSRSTGSRSTGSTSSRSTGSTSSRSTSSRSNEYIGRNGQPVALAADGKPRAGVVFQSGGNIGTNRWQKRVKGPNGNLRTVFVSAGARGGGRGGGGGGRGGGGLPRGWSPGRGEPIRNPAQRTAQPSTAQAAPVNHTRAVRPARPALVLTNPTQDDDEGAMTLPLAARASTTRRDDDMPPSLPFRGSARELPQPETVYEPVDMPPRRRAAGRIRRAQLASVGERAATRRLYAPAKPTEKQRLPVADTERAAVVAAQYIRDYEDLKGTIQGNIKHYTNWRSQSGLPGGPRFRSMLGPLSAHASDPPPKTRKDWRQLMDYAMARRGWSLHTIDKLNAVVRERDRMMRSKDAADFADDVDDAVRIASYLIRHFTP